MDKDHNHFLRMLREQKAHQRLIDEAFNENLERRKRYWAGTIGPRDDFGEPITDEFIDGLARGQRWAIMTPASFATHGYGRLGTGFGQRYRKQPDGRWLKIEG